MQQIHEGYFETQAGQTHKAQLQLMPQKTVGDGNCAFHAIFGVLSNGVHSGSYYHSDHCQKRRELGKQLLQKRKNPQYLDRIVNGIVGLITDRSNDIGDGCDALLNLQNKQKEFEENQRGEIDAAWQRFEYMLTQRADILEYINQWHRHPKGKLANLHEKFHDVLSRDSGQLRSIIDTHSETFAANLNQDGLSDAHLGNFDKSHIYDSAKFQNREKLHNEEWVKQKLQSLIPGSYELSAAISEGDCFYDAVALTLNQVQKTNSYSPESIRRLCFDYLQDEAKSGWVREAVRKDRGDYTDFSVYRARVQYTKADWPTDFGEALPVWGRPEIEGRILCAILGIRLHIIEVLEQSIDGVAVIQAVVGPEGSHSIEEMSLEQYDQKDLIHLVNHHNHFVPLLRVDRHDASQKNPIDSNKALMLALKNYNDKAAVTFDMRANISDDVIEEYLALICRPGICMSMYEIDLIAHVFDLTIDYYHGCNVSPTETFNPGKLNTVSIRFDGHSHFERMAIEKLPIVHSVINETRGAQLSVGKDLYYYQDKLLRNSYFAILRELSQLFLRDSVNHVRQQLGAQYLLSRQSSSQWGDRVPQYQTTVFISYAQEELSREWITHNLHKHLLELGCHVYFDDSNMTTGIAFEKFERAIDKATFVLVIATPLYKAKYDAFRQYGKTNARSGVSDEMEMIEQRLGDPRLQDYVIPVVLPGRIPKLSVNSTNDNVTISVSGDCPIDGGYQFLPSPLAGKFGLNCCDGQARKNTVYYKESFHFFKTLYGIPESRYFELKRHKKLFLKAQSIIFNLSEMQIAPYKQKIDSDKAQFDAEVEALVSKGLLIPQAAEGNTVGVFTKYAQSDDEQRHEALIQAIQEGKSSMVAAAMRISKKLDVQWKDVLGDTPLHYSAAQGDTDASDELLKAGVDIESVNEDYNTPLSEAAAKVQLPTISSLLAHGASCITSNVEKRSPFDRLLVQTQQTASKSKPDAQQQENKKQAALALISAQAHQEHKEPTVVLTEKTKQAAYTLQKSEIKSLKKKLSQTHSLVLSAVHCDVGRLRFGFYQVKNDKDAALRCLLGEESRYSQFNEIFRRHILVEELKQIVSQPVGLQSKIIRELLLKDMMAYYQAYFTNLVLPQLLTSFPDKLKRAFDTAKQQEQAQKQFFTPDFSIYLNDYLDYIENNAQDNVPILLGGFLDAVAELHGIRVCYWREEDSKLRSIHEYKPRQVNLFIHILHQGLSFDILKSQAREGILITPLDEKVKKAVKDVTDKELLNSDQQWQLEISFYRWQQMNAEQAKDPEKWQLTLRNIRALLAFESYNLDTVRSVLHQPAEEIRPKRSVDTKVVPPNKKETKKNLEKIMIRDIITDLKSIAFFIENTNKRIGAREAFSLANLSESERNKIQNDCLSIVEKTENLRGGELYYLYHQALRYAFIFLPESENSKVFLHENSTFNIDKESNAIFSILSSALISCEGISDNLLSTDHRLLNLFLNYLTTECYSNTLSKLFKISDREKNILRGLLTKMEVWLDDIAELDFIKEKKDQEKVALLDVYSKNLKKRIDNLDEFGYMVIPNGFIKFSSWTSDRALQNYQYTKFSEDLSKFNGEANFLAAIISNPADPNENLRNWDQISSASPYHQISRNLSKTKMRISFSHENIPLKNITHDLLKMMSTFRVSPPGRGDYEYQHLYEIIFPYFGGEKVYDKEETALYRSIKENKFFSPWNLVKNVFYFLLLKYFGNEGIEVYRKIMLDFKYDVFCKLAAILKETNQKNREKCIYFLNQMRVNLSKSILRFHQVNDLFANETHNDTNNNPQTKGYKRRSIPSDGDCGYTAFGISRDDAVRELIDNLDAIKERIIPAVKEALLESEDGGFFTHLVKSPSCQINNLDVSEREIVQNLDYYSGKKEVLEQYIYYDVRDKRIDNGWAHPAILHALGQIRNIEIKIWRLGSKEMLVKHAFKDFFDYHATNLDHPQSIKHLLFINNNHFEVLDMIGYEENSVDEAIYPAYLSENRLTLTSNNFFYKAFLDKMQQIDAEIEETVNQNNVEEKKTRFIYDEKIKNNSFSALFSKLELIDRQFLFKTVTESIHSVETIKKRVTIVPDQSGSHYHRISQLEQLIKKLSTGKINAACQVIAHTEKLLFSLLHSRELSNWYQDSPQNIEATIASLYQIRNSYQTAISVVQSNESNDNRSIYYYNPATYSKCFIINLLIYAMIDAVLKRSYYCSEFNQHGIYMKFNYKYELTHIIPALLIDDSQFTNLLMQLVSYFRSRSNSDTSKPLLCNSVDVDAEFSLTVIKRFHPDKFQQLEEWYRNRCYENAKLSERDRKSDVSPKAERKNKILAEYSPASFQYLRRSVATAMPPSACYYCIKCDNKGFSRIIYEHPERGYWQDNFVTSLNENEIISTQQQKPDDTTKSQYFTLGFIRTNARIKYSRLYIALKRHELSFEVEEQCVLIKQALFEIDELFSVTSSPCTLLQEKLRNERFASIFLKVFYDHLITFRHKMTQYNAVKNILDILLALYSFCPQGAQREITGYIKEAKNIISAWIRKQQTNNHLLTESDRNLRGLLYGLHIISHTKLSSLNSDDVKAIVSARIVIEQNSRLEIKLPASVYNVVMQFFYERFSEIKRTMSENLSLLNDTIKTVVNLSLHDEHFSYDSSEEIFKSGSYALDLVKGILYKDGAPLAAMPRAVYNHRDYKECFPNMSKFLVSTDRPVISGNSLIRYTSEGIDSDYVYRITLLDKNCSGIFIEKKKKEEMEKDYKTFVPRRYLKGSFPHCLVDNHTHWWSQNNIIEIIDDSGKCAFQMRLHENAIYSNKYQNYLIPFYNSNRKNQLYEHFLKIEDENYILFMKDSAQDNDSVAMIKLPRLGISFSLVNGDLLSNECRGYKLSKSQHIDSLSGLSQYLILVSTTKNQGILSEKQIIIPNRQIRERSSLYSNSISLDFSIENPAYFVYRYDPLLKEVKADDIAGTLYLALLYFKTATLSRDIFSEKSGYEIAVDLLKKCWKNEPYSKTELNILMRFLNAERAQLKSWNIIDDRNAFKVFSVLRNSIFSYKDRSSAAIAIWMRAMYLWHESLGTYFLNTKETAMEQAKININEMKKFLRNHFFKYFSLYLKAKKNIHISCLLSAEEEMSLLKSCEKFTDSMPKRFKHYIQKLQGSIEGFPSTIGLLYPVNYRRTYDDFFSYEKFRSIPFQNYSQKFNISVINSRKPVAALLSSYINLTFDDKDFLDLYRIARSFREGEVNCSREYFKNVLFSFALQNRYYSTYLFNFTDDNQSTESRGFHLYLNQKSKKVHVKIVYDKYRKEDLCLTDISGSEPLLRKIKWPNNSSNIYQQKIDKELIAFIKNHVNKKNIDYLIPAPELNNKKSEFLIQLLYIVTTYPEKFYDIPSFLLSNTAYDYKMILEKKSISSIGRERGFYLYRNGNPEKIYVLVVHDRNRSEVLCLTNIANKSKFSLSELDWSEESQGRPVKISDQLVDLILLNCTQFLETYYDCYIVASVMNFFSLKGYDYDANQKIREEFVKAFSSHYLDEKGFFQYSIAEAENLTVSAFRQNLENKGFGWKSGMDEFFPQIKDYCVFAAKSNEIRKFFISVANKCEDIVSQDFPIRLESKIIKDVRSNFDLKKASSSDDFEMKVVDKDYIQFDKIDLSQIEEEPFTEKLHQFFSKSVSYPEAIQFPIDISNISENAKARNVFASGYGRTFIKDLKESYSTAIPVRVSEEQSALFEPLAIENNEQVFSFLNISRARAKEILISDSNFESTKELLLEKIKEKPLSESFTGSLNQEAKNAYKKWKLANDALDTFLVEIVAPLLPFSAEDIRSKNAQDLEIELEELEHDEESCELNSLYKKEKIAKKKMYNVLLSKDNITLELEKMLSSTNFLDKKLVEVIVSPENKNVYIFKRDDSKVYLECEYPSLSVNSLGNDIYILFIKDKKYFLKFKNIFPFSEADNFPKLSDVFLENGLLKMGYLQRPIVSYKLLKSVESLKALIDNQLCSELNKITVLNQHLKSIFWLRNFLTSHHFILFLEQLSGAHKTFHKRGVLSVTKSESLIGELNPFISKKDYPYVSKVVKIYLKRIIFCMKLRRALSLISQYINLNQNTPDEERSQLIENIAITLFSEFTYDTEKNAHWLLFELENNLMIRQNQTALIDAMSKDRQNSMYQLNMGEGKTSVILVLLAKLLQEQGNIVRINVLEPLLSVMKNLLISKFSGFLSTRIYCMPFSRDVDISTDNLERMKEILHTCKKEGGILLVTPNHRMCLQLKWQEKLLQYLEVKDAKGFFDWDFCASFYPKETRKSYITDYKSDMRDILLILNYIDSNDRILRYPKDNKILDFFVEIREKEKERNDGKRCFGIRGSYFSLRYGSVNFKKEIEQQVKLLTEINKFEICDILDESDEILRYGSELNYTRGSSKLFDAAPYRWNLPIWLLQLVFFDNDVLLKLREGSVTGDIVFNQSWLPASNIGGGIPLVRFVNENFFNKHIRSILIDKILSKISQELIHHEVEFSPLADLLPGIPNSNAKDFVSGNLLAIVTWDGSEISKEEAILRMFASSSLLNLLLLAKAWLTHGLLFHVMSRSYRVEYGLNSKPDELPKKALAVPYKGKDTPSERSDFSHPEVTIGFTILSYLYEGLHVSQIKQTLLKLKKNAYHQADSNLSQWVELCSDWINQLVQKGDEFVEFPDWLRSFKTLDLDNPSYLEKARRCMGRSYGLVAYYLERIVFPGNAHHYPYKISANSHTIAGDGENKGFSGTDDRRDTMPDMIVSKKLPSQLGTNGKMLHILSREKNTSYATFDCATTKDFLDLVCSHTKKDALCYALIDAGAIICGMNNYQAASYLSVRLDKRFKGIVYFDDDSGNIMVLLRENSQIFPIAACHLSKLEIFVYLDDVHTRGTDLVMPLNARAILTLGRDMNKDKFMQAAMRLRQLDYQQSVFIWGSQQTSYDILSVNGLADVDQIRSRHVLIWLTYNTIQKNSADLYSVTMQKLQYVIKRRAVDYQKNDEYIPFASLITQFQEEVPDQVSKLYRFSPKTFNALQIKNLLGGKLLRLYDRFWQTIGEDIHVTRNSYPDSRLTLFSEEKRRFDADNDYKEMEEVVRKVASKLPSSMVISAELEQDEEKEKELEEEQISDSVPVELRKPQEFIAWNYSSIFTNNFIDSGKKRISGYPHLLPLERCFEYVNSEILEFYKNGRSMLKWRNNILVTYNFIHTVYGGAASNHQDEYLRPADMILVYKKIDRPYFVLLSGFEANSIIRLFDKQTDNSVFLIHLNDEERTMQYPFSGDRLTLNQEMKEVFTLLKLFNGQCHYADDEIVMLKKSLGIVDRNFPHYDQLQRRNYINYGFFRQSFHDKIENNHPLFDGDTSDPAEIEVRSRVSSVVESSIGRNVHALTLFQKSFRNLVDLRGHMSEYGGSALEKVMK